MSFNKRTFSESSIRKSAKNMIFSDFQRWMCSTDAAMLDDSFASMIYDMFMKAANSERKEIYEQIKSDEI